MNLLVITEPFVGLKDFFYGLTDQDSGQPAFYHVLKELDRQGHQVFVIVPSAYAQSKISKIWNNTQILSFHSPPFNDKWNLCGRVRFYGVDLRFIFHLLQAIYFGLRITRESKFDLITGHWEFAALAAYIVGKIRMVPNVSRLYGSNLIARTGGKLNWINKLKNINRVIPFVTPASVYICTQDGTQGDKVAAHFKIPKEKFIHILNGVELDVLPASKGKGTPVDITFIGHFQGWKHPMRVLELVPNIVEHHQDVRFNFIGSGVEEPDMRNFINVHHLERYVTIYGRLTQSEKNKILANTDIYVSFYAYSNLSNTMLEALTYGKAILTLNEGDTGLVLKNGQNAVLLSSWDREQALEQLLSLIEDPEKRESLGREARSWAENHLTSWVKRARVEIEIYEKTIETKAFPIVRAVN